MRIPAMWRAITAERVRHPLLRASRTRKTIAALTALMVTIAGVVVALRLASVPPSGLPVQQQGSAAGLPHRVPASATIARLVNGRVVRDRSSLAHTGWQLPAALRPKGAIPPAATPPPVKLGRHEPRPPERLRSLPSPVAPRVAGFSPRTSRATRSGTSADQTTYQNADGTRTSFLYQEPVNYRQPDWSWARVNPNLVPAGPASPPPAALSPSAPYTTLSPSGDAPPAISPSASSSPSPSTSTSSGSTAGPVERGWRERAAAEPERFAAAANGSPLALLPLGGKTSLGLSVLGATAAAGTVDGSAITYPGVRPGADIQLTAGAGKAGLRLILHSASAPDSWVFPLRLAGLRVRLDSGGGAEFVSPAGRVVAVLPRAVMTDSKISPGSGAGATSAGVSYALVTVDGHPALRVSLDQAWLDSRERVFPVISDLGIGSFNSGGTEFVNSDNATTSTGPEILVGTNGYSNRSFMKFDSVSSLTNDKVLGVRLGLFNTFSASCSPSLLQVYPVTSAWTVGGAQTYPGPSTGPSVGSKSFATGYVVPGASTSQCPASWEGIDLNQAGTNVVNGWTHGTTPNDGLALAASSDPNAYKKFSSDNVTNGDPFLSVTYTADAASYALASNQPVTPVEASQDGQIAVKVTNTGSTSWGANGGTTGYQMSYVAYNTSGGKVANAPVFTNLPIQVNPGGTAIVDVNVNSLPVGTYAINFSMYHNGVSFLSDGIPPLAVGLTIPQPPPVVTKVYPPTGYVSSTATPELSTTATGTGTITYLFSLTCQPLPGTICGGGTINSPTLSVPYWTPPPLSWNEPYTWQVKVTASGVSTTIGPIWITPEVPQPVITSGLGEAEGQAFDPQSGNFTTSATDAAVAVAGPTLGIDRSYNSLDPRANGAFGAGWSSEIDASVMPDNDGSNDMLVTLPDGQQMRFGYDTTTQTYVPPMGSPDTLVQDSDGGWTLMDSSGSKYEFTSTGRLSQITNANGLTQELTATSGEITTITDSASGRSLTLAWETPPGALYPHVTSVTTSPPTAGQSGLTWTYKYTGDQLTSFCTPTSNCTSYSYTTGSDYRSAVLDAGPMSYWQFGDASGATTAADEVDANLGTTSGTYSNVTLGEPGPLAGSSETAAGFNGASSSVTLPTGQISNQSYISIGVWFKAASSTASGVLVGYQQDALSDASGNNDPHDPALYVGGDGRLYGELWNGSIDPMSSGTINVDNGNWHYAVLTGSGTSQSLWLDGTQVATMSGQIAPDGLTNDTAGAGFWGTGWPADYLNAGPGQINTPIGYFDGSIAQAAIYPHPLDPAQIASQLSVAGSPSAELTQVTLPSGRIYQQASYDPAQDRVATYTDPNGGQWQVGQPLATGYKQSASSLGVVTRYVPVTSPAGYDQVYGYDAINGGRLVSYTPYNPTSGNGPNIGDTPETFGYDQSGYLNQVVDSDGNEIALTNDAEGNVLTRTWFPIEPAVRTKEARKGLRADTVSSPCSSPCTTYYGYYPPDQSNPLDPRNNKLVSVRDARSASATDNTYLTQYVYNPQGELTSSTSPATSDFPNGRTTTYGYTTTSTAAYGGGTTPPGLLASATTPGDATTSYEYYSDGDLAQVTTPAGARTVYAYDGLGRAQTSTVYSDTYPGGLTTSYIYNPVNQLSTVTYPGVVNAVTGVTHTQQDTYSYDVDGNLTEEIQSDLTGGDTQRTTKYAYNDFGELASVTDPAGDTTGYSYDGSGNVATKVDGDGNEYDYTYNEYNEPLTVTLNTNSTSQSDPGGGASLVLDSYSYDPAGLLSTATDAMGRTTQYLYDNDENLISVQDAPSGQTGRRTTYTYDGAGNLIETDISDPTDNTEDPAAGIQTVTDYNYDAADRLSNMVVDPTPPGTSDGGYLDRTTTYSYNADNEVTSSTLTGNNGSATTNYGYNSADELTSDSVPEGNGTIKTTTWAYDELGQVRSTVAPDGNVPGANAGNFTTSYTYDQAGNLASSMGPAIATQTYQSQTPTTTQPVTTDGYDTFGDQTQAEDPDGNTTTAGYDGDGRLASFTQPSYTPPDSSTAITATTSYTYDGNGNLASFTDPEGNTTSYGYDAIGDLTTVTDPQLTGQSAPGVWTYGYDADGELTSTTSPTNATTHATYDGLGNLATWTQDITTSSGTTHNTTNFTNYDYLGDPWMVTTPDGIVTTSIYDHIGELASSTDAYGNTTSYGYDYAGRLLDVIRPDTTSTVWGYDPSGDVTSVTDYGQPQGAGIPPTLAAWGYDYDASGNLKSVTDPDTYTTTYAYNAGNELTSATQPLTPTTSATTGFGYDPAGNQTSITDGRNNTTWTTYNPWNLPESVIEPPTTAAPTAGKRTWTTSYTADGQVGSVSQPGGITLNYGYDQIGDLTTESGTGAAATTPSQTFGYYPDGHLASATAPGGTDQFSYNGAGELKSATGPSGSATFGYNGDNLMTSRADAAGTTSYTYDNDDRLYTASDPLTGATLTYGYTPNSQPHTISYSVSGAAGPTRTLGYDGMQRLASDTLASSGGATIASATYLYNGDSDLTSEITTGYAGAASTTYGYNEADELTSSTTGGATTTYGYNAAGDLNQAGGTTYTYNPQDQLTTATASGATTTYGYTLSGALNSITPPSGPAQNYTSNAYGQTATAPGGLSYAYDALGRLVTRTASSASASLAYSGLGNTVASDATTSTLYTYDPTGDPLASQIGTSVAKADLTNVHDDLTGAFKPVAATTSLSASAAYSPYGTITTASGTMPSLGYQDNYTDPSTGNVDMAARWYAPSTGTFTSNDTINGSPLPSTADGTPYGYTNGNPLTNEDPTGHCSMLSIDCDFDAIVRGLEDVGRGIEETGGSPFWDVFGAFEGGLELWGISSFFFPTPGASGCADILCGGYYGNNNEPCYFCHVPVGSWTWTSANPGGGGPQPCGYDCYYTPPPPPPPPQDCYAGPDPTCTPPPAPRSLRDTKYLSQTASNITNPKQLPHGDTITEPTPTEWQLLNELHQQTTGASPEPGENGTEAAGQGANGNTTLAGTPYGSTGEPPTPEPPGPAPIPNSTQLQLPFPTADNTPPQTSTSSGNIGGGNGGITNPPAPACEPEDNGQHPLSQPGALREAAVQVHNLATPTVRFNESTVALAQVDVPGAESQYFASASGGILSPEQVALLKELGVPEGNILTAQPGHAEMNIINALKPEGATISRWGIAWGSKNNPNPCSKCAPSINGTIEGTTSC